MSFFRSIRDRLFKDRQPGQSIYGFSGSSSAGVPVTEDMSMRYAAVQACVRVLSEDIAALPLYLYMRTEKGGKQRYYEHPLYRILRTQPNPEMTAITFRETLMVNVLLTGNAYCFIEYSGDGRIMALWPMVSTEVSPYRDSRGAIRYRAGTTDLSAAEVLHIPGLGYDGLVGMSPIAYARETIGLGVAAERFGSAFFRNGTHLGGVITVPSHLSDEAFERTRAQFQQMYRGMQNAHGVPLLEGGATFTSVGIAPDDAQFLETRKYQRSEIAGIFRVPPHMIGDLEHATFSNIEHQEISYLQRSLLPWLTRIEQAMTVKLLTEEERNTYVIEHETTSFMRGDTKSRFDAYAVGIQNGILSVNEARAKENLNPVDGGDEIRVPLNTEAVGEDQAGAGSGADVGGQRSAFRLVDVSDFMTDSRRRAVGRRENAADTEKTGALRASFSAWLGGQAEEIRAMIQDALDGGIDQAELENRLTAYFGGRVPDDVLQAVKAVTDEGIEAVKEDTTEEEHARIDDTWIRGFDSRYAEEMSDRLNKANRNAALAYIGTGLADALVKLETWKTERADSMARNEYHFAMNEALIAGYRASGYQSVWDSGAGCCPICQQYNEQTVTTLKPPLHKGCSCGVRKGEKINKEPLKDSGEYDTITIDGQTFPLIFRDVKQQEHIEGTQAYKNRAKQQIEKIGMAQSYFYKDVDVEALCTPEIGKHKPTIKHGGGAREYFKAPYIIGVSVNDGYDGIETDCVAIEYGGKGWHAYPVTGRKKE